MRSVLMSLAGVMVAVSVFSAGNSADAAIINVDFESAPLLSLPQSVIDPNGTVFFSGPSSAVVANGFVGSAQLIYGNRSLLIQGGQVAVSASTAFFDFKQLNVFASVGGTLTVNANVFALSAGSNFLGINLNNVAGVNISSNVANILLDNIQINTISAAAVPEPASAAALCLGSLAVVVRRLRRRNPVAA